MSRPPRADRLRRHFAPSLLLVLVLAGCAGAPRLPGAGPSAPVASPSSPSLTQGDRLASLASGLIGQPYRYGGDGPQGFDCSGLALYVHQQLGIAVPRTAVLQRQQAVALDRSELRAGDLVFFTMGARLLVDHVGIYVGDGRFVHAPRAGRPVRLSRIDDAVYGARFAGGARYWQ
jgi:cell wall-associated NlpC family hydrolase